MCSASVGQFAVRDQQARQRDFQFGAVWHLGASCQTAPQTEAKLCHRKRNAIDNREHLVETGQSVTARDRVRGAPAPVLQSCPAASGCACLRHQAAADRRPSHWGRSDRAGTRARHAAGAPNR